MSQFLSLAKIWQTIIIIDDTRVIIFPIMAGVAICLYYFQVPSQILESVWSSFLKNLSVENLRTSFRDPGISFTDIWTLQLALSNGLLNYSSHPHSEVRHGVYKNTQAPDSPNQRTLLPHYCPGTVLTPLQELGATATFLHFLTRDRHQLMAHKCRAFYIQEAQNPTDLGETF